MAEDVRNRKAHAHEPTHLGKANKQTRLFFGTHQVTVQLPDGRTVTREVHCQRGGGNRFEVVVT